MISTRDLSELPTIESLRELTQALAMLDAVIMREWEYRYYSFNNHWADGEQMASMRNGEGDAWFCVFGPCGVFLKGFDHESVMSPRGKSVRQVWPGVLDDVPEDFQPFAKEPAFSMEDTTFCIWRHTRDASWNVGGISYPGGEDPDGSAWMMAVLDGQPESYQSFAEDYYDRPVSRNAVQMVYRHVPLTSELVKELNASVDLKDVLDDAAEIGYPIAFG